MSFTVNVRREGAGVTVAASGEVDLATAAVLDREIQTAITSPDVAEVIVDLSDVGFLDSSGIKALVLGRKLADSRGVLFGATGAHGLVREVLDLAGLREHLLRHG